MCQHDDGNTPEGSTAVLEPETIAPVSDLPKGDGVQVFRSGNSGNLYIATSKGIFLFDPFVLGRVKGSVLVTPSIGYTTVAELSAGGFDEFAPVSTYGQPAAEQEYTPFATIEEASNAVLGVLDDNGVLDPSDRTALLTIAGNVRKFQHQGVNAFAPVFSRDLINGLTPIQVSQVVTELILAGQDIAIHQPELAIAYYATKATDESVYANAVLSGILN